MTPDSDPALDALPSAAPARTPGMTHPHGRGGKRADLADRYFRSAWEANYARYLSWLLAAGTIREWTYEGAVFAFAAIRRGCRFYTPDFRVVWADGRVDYHEIKGWMDAKSRTKLDRMRRYHPTVPLIVIDGPAYRALARRMAPLIPTWE